MLFERIFRLNRFTLVLDDYKQFEAGFIDNVKLNDNKKPYELINPDVPVDSVWPDYYFIDTINKDLEDTPYTVGKCRKGGYGIWEKADNTYWGGEVFEERPKDLILLLLEVLNLETTYHDNIESDVILDSFLPGGY